MFNCSIFSSCGNGSGGGGGGGQGKMASVEQSSIGNGGTAGVGEPRISLGGNGGSGGNVISCNDSNGAGPGCCNLYFATVLSPVDGPPDVPFSVQLELVLSPSSDSCNFRS